jgi:hypothetical protein
MSAPQTDKEKAEGIATAVVDAMRSQPMMLAIIVLNLIIFVLLYFSATDVRKREHKLLLTIVERCIPRADPI